MLYFLLCCVLISPFSLAVPNDETNENDAHESRTDLKLDNDGSSDRDGKFFPVVKVVSFENTPCIAASGLVGTCYSKKECVHFNGYPSGKCANGYGACCVVKATCDTVITLNNTYFQSPGFPSSYSQNGMCMVELYLPKGTVQVKLEFLSFDISGPVDGDCGNDTFIISGVNAGSLIPVLCGYNSGQHLFLNVDNSNGPHKLIFTSTGLPYDRNWNMLVSFLSDYDPCKAPPRCLQYYNDISGAVSSFNYGSHYSPMLLNNMHYSVCFAYIPGYCDIGLTFSNLDLGVEDICICTEDYLAIQGTTICGTSTGLTVQANATGPIILHVWSNDDNSLQQRGFSFSYMNLPC